MSCEIWTRDGWGRIDILIESQAGDAAIVVENKPWTVWQPDQLRRYCADRQGRAQLFVVALVGGTEDAAREVRRHWRDDTLVPPAPDPLPGCVIGKSYHDVARWLEDCLGMASDAHLEGVLKGLVRYCRHDVMGERAMTEADHLAERIRDGGGKTIAAALEIEAAVKLLRNRSVAEVVKTIQGWKLGWTAQPTKGGVKVRRGNRGLDFGLVGGADYRPWLGIPHGFEGLPVPDQLKQRSDSICSHWEFLDALPAVSELRDAIEAMAVDMIADEIMRIVTTVERTGQLPQPLRRTRRPRPF